jgi:hypothetical protein
MDEMEKRLNLIKEIITAEESFLISEPKGYWYGDKFDILYDDDLLSLQLKSNLLKRKLNESKNKNRRG